MNPLWTLVSKEIRDNIRDRRSLFFALLYGPVLLPLLMVGPMLYGINQHTIDHESPTEIAVEGKEHAPSLMQFLHRHYLDAVPAPEDIEQALADGEFDIVLSIPETFGERFADGQPAPLVIHYTSDKDDSNNRRRQLGSVLERYSEQVRAQRFSSRGIDSRTFEPLDISEQDQSDAPGDLLTIAYLIPFLLMFSMLMGGYYLAVDTTAGERERQSLEPLLSLPLKRYQIVLGKYLAILAFVSLAMVLPLMTSFLLFSFLPMDLFDHRLHFGAQTFAIALLSNIPSALLITGFLMAIAAFTRNTKEAQTHLSFAMFLPIAPFFALQFLSVPRDTLTMLIPLLSQFQIMEMAVFGHAIPPHYLLLSAGGSMAVAAICVATAIRLYQRERILL